MKLKRRTILAGVIMALMVGTIAYAVGEISSGVSNNEQVNQTKQTEVQEQVDSKQSDKDALNQYENSGKPNDTNTNPANSTPQRKYDKVAYITIDDGPSEYTDKMVQILKDNGVNATFFMVNGNMKAYPNQVKNALKNGNSIGFHSVSHDIHKLYKTINTPKEEFDTCAQTYKSITGQESKLIRIPFGSKPYTPQKSMDILADSGYKTWDWTLDSEDWKSTSEQLLANIKKYTGGSEIVLLIHERKQTVAVLDDIIKYLKSEGYEILPIQQDQQEENYWNGKLGTQN